jgi:arylsulfatase A-like enzyme
MMRRTVVRFWAAPPWLGAGYVLALSAWAGAHGPASEGDLGSAGRAQAMAAFIERQFSPEVSRMKVGIVATALGVGIAVGLVADLLMRMRYRTEALERRSTTARVLEGLVLVMGIHGLWVLRAMALSPQLYASSFYAVGGLPRTVQVLATDTLGPRGVMLLGAALVVAYVTPANIVHFAHVVRGHGRWWGVGGAACALLVWSIGGLERAASSPSANRPLRPVHDRDPANAEGRVQPNILILAADSFCADKLNPRLTPNMARLAEQSTVFERAYVSLPRTFSSWVTLLTGRYPHHHGIRSMFPTWDDRARDFDALPSRLQKAGYRTAIVSDYAGDIFGRIELGFQSVDTPSFDFRQLIRQKALERELPLLPWLHSRTGRRVFPVMRELSAAADPSMLSDDVARALRAMSDGPFLLTVFFSTAHFPYAAPAPFYAQYTDKDYRGRFKYHKPVGLGLADEVPPDARDIAQVRGLYEGAITSIDEAMGRVLMLLRQLGIAERTLVIVTADHGETLYEHGRGQGHGDHLFGDEGTHVPLVVFDPRAPVGRRSPSITRDVDLAPTLYELANVPAPPDLDGLSLVPAMRGDRSDTRFAYAETELWFTERIPGLAPELRLPYPGVMGLTEIDPRHGAEIVLRKDMQALTTMARHRMIRDERWKLIYAPTRQGVRYLLFDTESDPEELHDVASAHPDEVKRLRVPLWSWMLSDRAMEAKDGFLVPRSVQ